MGTRKVIKAKANKKSRSAQATSSTTLSGGSTGHRVLPTGHVRKAKHHQAQEGHHKEQARNLGIHRDTGKVKRSRMVSPGHAAEHDKAAAKHGAAKRAHIKAAKSRKKK